VSGVFLLESFMLFLSKCMVLLESLEGFGKKALFLLLLTAILFSCLIFVNKTEAV
jgi:hypothetical protein